MNGGSNTEAKYHEEDCKYIFWLNLQDVLQNPDLGVNNEEKEDNSRP